MYFSRQIMLMLVMMSLTGCIGGSSTPANFYLLEPIANSEKQQVSKTSIILYAVRIPEYADRSQIVRAIAKNSYQINESNRWAESLDKNITRVLMQNLTMLVPAEVYLSSPSNLAKQAKTKLSVNIVEFFIDPQGQARLTAQWSVAQGDGQLSNKQVTYQSPASTTDFSKMVAALNDCLSQMSRELAIALQQVGH